MHLDHQTPNPNDDIRILITGGTFDKEYNYITGQLYFRDTHLPEMLETGRCTLDIKFRTLMMIDSLDMSEEDRNLIVRSVKNCPESRVVITHGTDTMAVTAKRIAEEKLDKTIVLTGAMIPYKFGSSDGFFNMGSALAFCQVLEPGVYIAINGRYFTWDNVVKNKTTGFFENMRT